MKTFVYIGPAEVLHVTKKAVLFEFDCEDYGESPRQAWVPQSILSVSTLAVCEEGARLPTIRVESWWANNNGFEA